MLAGVYLSVYASLLLDFVYVSVVLVLLVVDEGLVYFEYGFVLLLVLVVFEDGLEVDPEIPDVLPLPLLGGL